MGCDELLNEIKGNTSALVLSDLRFSVSQSELYRAICHIAFDKYSLDVWKAALSYMGFPSGVCCSYCDVFLMVAQCCRSTYVAQRDV